MAACAALVGVLISLYMTFSELRTALWAVVGLGGVVAVLTGVHVHRPAHRWPWWVLAAGLLAFTAGETFHPVRETYAHTSGALPSPWNACYLAVYPLLATGLLGLARYGWADRDLPGLLDALIITVGLALPVWVHLVAPPSRPESLTWQQRAIGIAYPLGGILLLALLALLLIPRPLYGGNRAMRLLVLGTLALLLSDIAHEILQRYGGPRTGTPSDSGWIVFCTAYGLAALHPSMAELTASKSRPGSLALLPPRRRLLLTGAMLIAPAVLIHEELLGNVRDASEIAAFSALLFLLVMLRLALLTVAHHRVVVRERELRTASASLMAAVRPEGIARACDTAAGTLFGPKVRHATLLLSARDAQALYTRLGPTCTGHPDVTAGAAPPRAGPAALARNRDVMVPVAALGTELAGRLGELPMALLCPLVRSARLPGAGLPGLLVAAGTERQLTEVRESLGILASHAGLATERLALRREIIHKESEAYFRTLVHNASDVILIVNGDTTVRYASPSARAVFGRAELIGTPLRELVDPRNRNRVDRTLRALRDDGQEEVHDNWWVTPATDDTEGRDRIEGTDRIEVEVRCRDLRHDRTVGGLVVTLRDVTEQHRLEHELTQRAFHDPLTGLPNRTLLLERTERALLRARRDPAVTCLLFIDLDDFKSVNDTLGHTVGDRLLGAVGERLSRMLRRSDTAARLGGDEFAVLMEDVKEPLDAELLAAQVVQTLNQPFRLCGESVSVSASVGVATARDSTDADEMLALADLALYAAKAAGKRQWRRFRPQQRVRMAERHELQARLNEAVSRGEFALRYQPVVDVTAGDVVGFEALVRWPQGRYGLVPPDEFIPLAEETGQISPLGAWVLRNAARDIARLQGAAQRSTAPYLSVNVSARQWRGTEFFDEVCGALDTPGLVPGTLLLEITESVLMQRHEELDTLVRALKDLGVRIAVDDFGTGFSSLRYLRELPVDVLKIDKTFIDDIARNARQVALVEGIIHLADTLGLEVIAEGIEEPAQQELLAGIGCRFGQGYLFAEPMTVEQGEFVLRRQGGERPSATWD
ncbi:EAL domain-containing protein [Streptomyces sp. T028]|uniref:EAL domain-containing protein n=1 Tax=Streptomyces sp. T028 TaxID=3394379 RepID=UPI003A84D131